MNEPEFAKISIITIVYNGESYLEETIQSVINQSYENIEYIIVDGLSTDGTHEIIKKYSNYITHFVSEKDNGIYDAMNKGLKLATGQWVNFLNGGDSFCHSNIIKEIFSDLPKTKYKFIYGDNFNVDSGRKKYIKAKKISRKSLKKNMSICHQSVFILTKIAPFYNLHYRYKAEYYWIIEIIYSISPQEILYIPSPIVNYSLGGFSEQGLLSNLKEQIHLSINQFGYLQTLLNSFFYLRVYLRYWKYKLLRNNNE